jgi:hypothetical protein
LQSVETANAVALAGKTVTLTVYVAGTAGKSPSIELGFSTTTDLGPVNAFTAITATSGTTTVTSSGTYQKLSAVYAVPSTAKTLRVSLATGTLNNTEFMNFSQCQLEIGSQATPFTRAGETIQGELAACQRYYWRAGGDSIFQPYGVGAGQTSTIAQFSIQNPVLMRVAPTSIDFSTLAATDTISAISISAVAFANAGKYASSINATVASGLSIYRPYILVSNNSTSGFFGLSAEL